MKKLKCIGKIMILAGGLLAAVMLIALARSFSTVPKDSSATVLAEAITPWNLFASLGLFILFVGLIFWAVGWFCVKRTKRNIRINNIEERLEAIEQKANPTEL